MFKRVILFLVVDPSESQVIEGSICRSMVDAEHLRSKWIDTMSEYQGMIDYQIYIVCGHAYIEDMYHV